MLSPKAFPFIPTSSVLQLNVSSLNKNTTKPNFYNEKQSMESAAIKLRSGIIEYKFNVKGLVVEEHVTSWLLALQPNDFTYVVIIGPIHCNWKTMLTNVWKNKLLQATNLNQVNDINLVLADRSYSPPTPLTDIPTILVSCTGVDNKVLTHRMFGGVTDFAT